MTMKTKMRECEEYSSVLDMDLSWEEGEGRIA